MRRRAFYGVRLYCLGATVPREGFPHAPFFPGDQNKNPNKITDLQNDRTDEGLDECRIEGAVDEICRNRKGKQCTDHAEKNTRCIHGALLPRTISPFLTALRHFFSLQEIYDETGAVSTHIYFF